jgi:hypothetical protein
MTCIMPAGSFFDKRRVVFDKRRVVDTSRVRIGYLKKCSPIDASAGCRLCGLSAPLAALKPIPAARDDRVE